MAATALDPATAWMKYIIFAINFVIWVSTTYFANRIPLSVFEKLAYGGREETKECFGSFFSCV